MTSFMMALSKKAFMRYTSIERNGNSSKRFFLGLKLFCFGHIFTIYYNVSLTHSRHKSVMYLCISLKIST